MSGTRTQADENTPLLLTDQVETEATEINSIQHYSQGLYRFVKGLSPAIFLYAVSPLPVPYSRMLECSLVPVMLKIEDVSNYLSKTQEPCLSLERAGWKGILKDGGRFVVGLVASTAVGVGLGLWEGFDLASIDGTPYLRVLFKNTLVHGPVFMGMGALFYSAGVITYNRCVPPAEEETLEQPELNIFQHGWHAMVGRPIPMMFMMGLLQVIVSTASRDVAINPHFSGLVLVLDQVMNGIDYLVKTPAPFKQLAKRDKWRELVKKIDDDLSGDQQAVQTVSAGKMAKALSWYGSRALFAMGVGFAVVELVNTALKADNADHRSYNEQVRILSWGAGLIAAQAAESLLENVASVRTTVAGCWSSVWARCKSNTPKEEKVDELEEGLLSNQTNHVSVVN